MNKIKRGLNANQLKGIAILSMTVDHLTSVIFPDFPREWWIILLHILGRIAAPIFWFFVAEGYHHTRDWKKYALRLFIFSIIGHFAYNFAFGIPFIPFQTTVFDQTSVIWALFWGLITLVINDSTRFKQWQKTLLVLIITAIAFCADWSSIAVMAILWIGTNRGNFRKQMIGMMVWVAMYVAVYVIFIDPVYGLIQFFVALSIPLLKQYNGQRGTWKGANRFFYVYYPLHLVICGIIRILLHGNIKVLIG